MAILTGARFSLVLAFLCALFFWPAREALAAEAGTSPYLSGYKDFMSGVLPPEPGIYLSDQTIYYNGDINRTTIGGHVEFSLNQWYVSNIIIPTVVTSYHILGGQYAFGVAVPILAPTVNASLSSNLLSRSVRDNAVNIGDVFFNPIILGWNAGDFHWNFAFTIAAPTGAYSTSNLANTGLNYWSFIPQFAVTYYEPHSGLDVSAAAAYVVNSENHATNYLTGNLFHLDWAVGDQITPLWKLGVSGDLMEQVTGDSGAGAVLGANEASAWAIGPIASYNLVINKFPVNIVGKWTHQVSATRTFKGDTVTLALNMKF